MLLRERVNHKINSRAATNSISTKSMARALNRRPSPARRRCWRSPKTTLPVMAAGAWEAAPKRSPSGSSPPLGRVFITTVAAVRSCKPCRVLEKAGERCMSRVAKLPSAGRRFRTLRVRCRAKDFHHPGARPLSARTTFAPNSILPTVCPLRAVNVTSYKMPTSQKMRARKNKPANHPRFPAAKARHSR